MIKSTHRATQMSNISLPSCVSSQTPGVSLPMAQSPWANTTETLGQEANSNSPAIVANVSVPIQPTLSHQGTSCNMALSALTSPWKQLCVAHLPTKQRRFPSLALKPSPASSPPHPYTNALLVSSACHHSASTAYIYALGSPGGLVRPKIAEPTSRASHSGSLGWDPKFCITNKFPGDADVASPAIHFANN